MHIFQCMGKVFYVEFQKEIFEIPHKISYPYIARFYFLYKVEILRILRFMSS